MAQLHTKTKTHTMGLLRISQHAIVFPYHPSILLPLWDCYGFQSTIAFPYHPSILLPLWDCYGFQSTIAFPYHPSILLPLWDCYGLQSNISFPYHPADIMGLLWVEKHHTIPTLSKHTAAGMGTILLLYHPDILASDTGII